MTSSWENLRHAARSLARSPGYVAVTVLLLALGIGANAAIFSAVEAVLLRPLPYSEPDRLVRVRETFNHGQGRGSVSYENYRDWRAEATLFQAFAAYFVGSRSLRGDGAPERVPALEATASLWEALGARPLAGRLFDESAELDPGERAVVLSEGLWRRRFGGDAAAVGATLVLDGEPHTVVGVLPARSRFPLYGEAPGVYLPLRPSASSNRGNHYLSVLARLRSDVTIDAGHGQLEQVAARLERAYPEAQSGRSVELRSLTDEVRGPVRPLLLLLFAAVGAVLAIVCANLASLSLARAEARRRTSAIRAALGASRGRLLAEQLAESALLVAGGTLGGLLVAQSLLAATRSAAASILPDLGVLAVDSTTVAFLLFASTATGLIFGLATALASAPDEAGHSLVVGGTRVAGHRHRQFARRALVTGQVALTLCLLLGAGLLLRSFARLQSTEPGFDSAGVLTAHLALPHTGEEPGALAPRLLTPLLARLQAIPGVESAGLVSLLPMQNWGSNTAYTVEGLEPPPASEPWWIEYRTASPGAFAALGVPLRAGRWLTEADGDVRDAASDAPLPALVNEALVRRHFPGGDAVGRRLNLWGTAVDVVGVVGDVRQAGLERDPLPELTLAYNDARVEPAFGDELVLAVRSSLPTASLAAMVRAAVTEVAPQQPLFNVQTLDQVVAASLAERRLALALVAAFAAIAALLAGTGLYALVAYLVAQRTREVGVRMALGASAAAIGRWVLGEGLALTAVGVALGLVGGWGASRLVASQLHGISPLDPLTWSAVVVFLVLVAAAATLAPAARAARVDPIEALRQE